MYVCVMLLFFSFHPPALVCLKHTRDSGNAKSLVAPTTFPPGEAHAGPLSPPHTGLWQHPSVPPPPWGHPTPREQRVGPFSAPRLGGTLLLSPCPAVTVTLPRAPYPHAGVPWCAARPRRARPAGRSCWVALGLMARSRLGTELSAPAPLCHCPQGVTRVHMHPTARSLWQFRLGSGPRRS